ncbi:MAG: hypothetical protein RL000_737 [Bacteroidota bacterium]|jgi:hypothetical protein
MKRYSKEELDELLKEKSDQYLLYPSDRVWKNIHQELHPSNGWRYASLTVLFFFIASLSIHVKKNELSKGLINNKETLYQYIETPSASLANNTLQLPEIFIPFHGLKQSNDATSINLLASSIMHANTIEHSNEISLPKNISTLPQISLPTAITTTNNITKEEKKHTLSETIDLVVTTAKKISKDIKWQLYGGPSIGYRSLEGKATRNIYQYAVYSLSTNAVFARDVKDVVNHRPAMGFELGTAMIYPLSKRINVRAGIQANYNQYQIKAFSAIPEIATYAVNNSNSSTPLSAVSVYRNNQGLSPATIQNEHYMISLPIGLDYRVSGTDKLNFSVGSSIQPTYVFANFSYLLSSNLQNYAKEPSLNRNWNINGAVEASVNFEHKGFRWSIAPQFRYQMLSSFKEKYPIKENLMDMGIKIGIIKTIK